MDWSFMYWMHCAKAEYIIDQVEPTRGTWLCNRLQIYRKSGVLQCKTPLFIYKCLNQTDFSNHKSCYFIIEIWLKISASTIIHAVNITIISIILLSFYRCSYTKGDTSPCFPRTLFPLTFHSSFLPFRLLLYACGDGSFSFVSSYIARLAPCNDAVCQPTMENAQRNKPMNVAMNATVQYT